ncbi:MAG TPA: hypothetical protein VK609_23130, partial [Mucilaginibacter sp.]|nr:hypothetical protein [Mucilaginibacter sp.]
STNAVERLKAAITANLVDINEYDKKFKEEKSLKDFTTIDANRVTIDKHMAPSNPLYIENLKKVLKCDNDSSGLFEQIRDLFFGFTFLSNMPSFDKRMKLEAIMNKNKVKPA